MTRTGLTLTAAACGCLLALGGCGDKTAAPAGGETGGNAQSGTGAAAGAMPANWKATDACAIVTKEAVAEALKLEVTDAQLGLVHEPGTADAGTSECTYIGKDGGSVAQVMTRWSPINDNTAETIAAARNTAAAAIKPFTDKPMEDIPGLGKAAFMAPGINALTVFIDDARMITLTPRKTGEGVSGKDAAIALAKKGGAGG